MCSLQCLLLVHAGDLEHIASSLLATSGGGDVCNLSHLILITQSSPVSDHYGSPLIHPGKKKSPSKLVISLSLLSIELKLALKDARLLRLPDN